MKGYLTLQSELGILRIFAQIKGLGLKGYLISLLAPTTVCCSVYGAPPKGSKNAERGNVSQEGTRNASSVLQFWGAPGGGYLCLRQTLNIQAKIAP